MERCVIFLVAEQHVGTFLDEKAGDSGYGMWTDVAGNSKTVTHLNEQRKLSKAKSKVSKYVYEGKLKIKINVQLIT